MFLRNAWYVFGWESELDNKGGLVGKTLLGEPVVVWREDGGALHAMENRCPHRRADLSLGRVDGDRLVCMYHGMTFSNDGVCVSMPLLAAPPKCALRVYPAVVKDSWIWVWMGQPDRADPALIPDAFGIDDPSRPMQAHSIEYDAHYQLVHDNLCDLSHVDFVHQTTLKVASGADWSATAPRIRQSDRGIRIERWFEDAGLPGDPDVRVDVWSTYDFFVPGIFVMRGARFPGGTAASVERREPVGIEPIVINVEQQAVTPISASRTAYLYATGLIGSAPETVDRVERRMAVVRAAFQEDREMIEAQQRIWDLTDQDVAMAFLPQDKGPFMMRKLMKTLIDRENQV